MTRKIKIKKRDAKQHYTQLRLIYGKWWLSILTLEHELVDRFGPFNWQTVDKINNKYIGLGYQKEK